MPIRLLLPLLFLIGMSTSMVVSCASIPSKPYVMRQHNLKPGELKGTVTVQVTSNSLSAQDLQATTSKIKNRFAQAGMQPVSKLARTDWTLIVTHQVKPVAMPPGADGSVPSTPRALKGSYEHSMTFFLFEKGNPDTRWGVSTTLIQPHQQSADVVAKLVDACITDLPGEVTR